MRKKEWKQREKKKVVSALKKSQTCAMREPVEKGRDEGRVREKCVSRLGSGRELRER